MSNDTIIPASILDTEELLRYAQMYLDRGDNIPLPWQQELLKRFIKELARSKI